MLFQKAKVLFKFAQCAFSKSKGAFLICSVCFFKKLASFYSKARLLFEIALEVNS